MVLKLSGEALGPEHGLGLDMTRVADVARQIKNAADRDVEIAVVVGAGNLVRGRRLAEQGANPTSADYMGMLATVMNGLALRDCLEKLGRRAALLSAIGMGEIAEPLSPRRCGELLEQGCVVILAAGTGNPHFTTDTAAALRARELCADIILKATNVDGVYSGDPARDPDAKLYQTVSYTECLSRGLKVMDATAIAMCRDSNVPVLVFNYKKPGNIERAIAGEDIGTRIGGP